MEFLRDGKKVLAADKELSFKTMNLPRRDINKAVKVFRRDNNRCLLNETERKYVEIGIRLREQYEQLHMNIGAEIDYVQEPILKGLTEEMVEQGITSFKNVYGIKEDRADKYLKEGIRIRGQQIERDREIVPRTFRVRLSRYDLLYLRFASTVFDSELAEVLHENRLRLYSIDLDIALDGGQEEIVTVETSKYGAQKIRSLLISRLESKIQLGQVIKSQWEQKEYIKTRNVE